MLSGETSYGAALLALLAVLGLLALLAVLLQRWRPVLLGMRDVGRLSVVETKLLDARTKLVLVRCDAREHLIVIASGAVSILPAQDPTPSGTAARPQCG